MKSRIGIVLCTLMIAVVYGFTLDIKLASVKTEAKGKEHLSACETSTIPINPVPATIIATKSNSGLYVNSFGAILGNIANETALLNWCNTQGFRTLNLSGINSAINSSSTTRNQLNAFIGLAKAAPYYKTINLVVGGANTAMGTYTNYYTNASYPNKFNGYVTEYEFWNDNAYTDPSNPATCPYYQEFANLTTTLAAISGSSPAIQRYAYIGNNFTDAACTSPITNPNCTANSSSCQSNTTTIINNILNNYNRLYLSYYQNTSCCAITSTMLNRLNVIANAAAALTKTVSIEVIYNVNYPSSAPPNTYDIYNYFATTSITASTYLPPPGNQPFSQAYTNFVTAFNALTLAQLPNKANLRIIGFNIFRYSEAKLARP